MSSSTGNWFRGRRALTHTTAWMWCAPSWLPDMESAHSVNEYNQTRIMYSVVCSSFDGSFCVRDVTGICIAKTIVSLKPHAIIMMRCVAAAASLLPKCTWTWSTSSVIRDVVLSFRCALIVSDSSVAVVWGLRLGDYYYYHYKRQFI